MKQKKNMRFNSQGIDRPIRIDHIDRFCQALCVFHKRKIQTILPFKSKCLKYLLNMAMTWGDYVLLCTRVRDFFYINKKREKKQLASVFVYLFVCLSLFQKHNESNMFAFQKCLTISCICSIQFQTFKITCYFPQFVCNLSELEKLLFVSCT